MLASGLSSAKVATELGIATSTVATHRANVYRKIGLHSDVELAHHAIAHGWIRVRGRRGPKRYLRN